MKITKRIIIALIFLVGGITALQAQKGQFCQIDPEKRAERMTQHMADELSLSEEQTAKVLAINLKFAKEHKALRANAQEGERPNRAEMENLREAHTAEIKPLLTEEQFAKLETLRPEREGKRGKGPRGMGRDFDPEEKAERMTQHMAESLELSDEQATKVKAIHLDAAQKMKALHSQNEDNPKANRGEMKKLRDEVKSEIKAVLTETQFKQWEEMRPERPRCRKGKLKQGDDERM